MPHTPEPGIDGAVTGSRTFRYRPADIAHRVLAVVLVGFSVLVWFAVVRLLVAAAGCDSPDRFVCQDMPTVPEALGAVLVGVVPLAGGVLAWRCSRRRLVVGDDGLAWRTGFARHHLTWAEIDQFEVVTTVWRQGYLRLTRHQEQPASALRRLLGDPRIVVFRCHLPLFGTVTHPTVSPRPGDDAPGELRDAYQAAYALHRRHRGDQRRRAARR